MGVEAFDEFAIGVPDPGYDKEIINSDDVKYAGSGRVNTRQVRAKKKPRHGMPYSITIKMPVVGAAIFRKNYNRKGH
jgi:1,4-alpha-glucan branching enzyme